MVRMVNLHNLLTQWKKNSHISDSVYGRLNRTDGILPRAYGLPKLHKPNCPLRIIVSSINSPLYNLSLFLHKLIYDNVPKAASRVINSFHLVSKLSTAKIEEHYKLISLDAVSLFTNIPLDLAISGIVKRWDDISGATTIPRDEFITALFLVLNFTFFSFDNNIYKQTFGSPMGSPLSPIIADIVLHDLESRALERIPVPIPFCVRYVDDIALASPPAFVDFIVNIFNSFHRRLQFTVEISNENSLNFLDVTMIISHGYLHFNWYKKHFQEDISISCLTILFVINGELYMDCLIGLFC